MNKVIKKCPSCGAVIEHKYNHRCPYCRQFLHVTDDDIQKLQNVNIVIDKVEAERIAEFRDMLITIYAKTYPKAYSYEEEYDNAIYISEARNSIGKRIAYRLAIPLETFYEAIYKRNINEIIDYILGSLPPLFREYEWEIIDKLLPQLERNKIN